MNGYLTKHCDDCQCRDDDPKYSTLCELLAVLAQQRREMQGEIDRLTIQRDAADEATRQMQDRLQRLIDATATGTLTEGTATP